MKVKGPNTSQSNPVRAAATLAAATLICLMSLPFGGAASAAGSKNRPRRQRPARTVTTPAATPAPTPAAEPEAEPAAGAADEPTQAPAAAAAGAGGKPADPSKAVAGQRVKLYYLRQGTEIAAALNELAKPKESFLNGFSVKSVTADELVLIGTKAQRKLAGGLIATLDLPRPGVQMEMWGVQISSKRPEDLAEVMRRVRFEIDQTQQEVRATYAKMQELAGDIRDEDLDPEFKTILEKHLRYETALDANRPLSLSDILLRLIAAKDPAQAAARMANELDGFLVELDGRRAVRRPAVGTKQCGSKSRAAKAAALRPKLSFERFFLTRGLVKGAAGGAWALRPTAAGGRDVVAENNKIGKAALLDFALQYERLVHDPENFDPYYLQQAAGALNTRLQLNIDALNRDVQEVFVEPTLDRIRLIASEFCDVSYAQVGRTTVASLSGADATVDAGSVNTFEFTKPLDLADWLTKAHTLGESVGKFIPNPAENVVGAMPYSQLIGLVGALGADRTETRKTKSGISVTITPNVLRNMNSAELDVKLTTGDPMFSGTEAQGTPQFTRVSQHDVKTRVYVNALDFFDLSAFGSQATMNGGRGYVPVIGPFWRGLFGEAPVIGEFLSWRKKPQTVYSQSLALTTSFITPTAMGVALLAPTSSPPPEEDCPERFRRLMSVINDYRVGLFDPSRKQLLGAPCPDRRDNRRATAP